MYALEKGLGRNHARTNQKKEKKKVVANTIKNNNAIVHMKYSEECKSMSQTLN